MHEMVMDICNQNIIHRNQPSSKNNTQKYEYMSQWIFFCQAFTFLSRNEWAYTCEGQGYLLQTVSK